MRHDNELIDHLSTGYRRAQENGELSRSSVQYRARGNIRGSREKNHVDFDCTWSRCELPTLIAVASLKIIIVIYYSSVASLSYFFATMPVNAINLLRSTLVSHPTFSQRYARCGWTTVWLKQVHLVVYVLSTVRVFLCLDVGMPSVPTVGNRTCGLGLWMKGLI